MDNADKDLSKTSDVKREAMVSKLHNMQWLKSTPHSANPYVYSLFLCLLSVYCMNVLRINK